MKLFELYRKRQLREDTKVLRESIKLCQAAIALMEADDFAWEPQPEFTGKGKSQDTGYGIKSAEQAKKKQQNAKINATWQKLVQQSQTLSGQAQKKLQQNMQQFAKAAEQRGFVLSPSPKATLGLGGM